MRSNAVRFLAVAACLCATLLLLAACSIPTSYSGTALPPAERTLTMPEDQSRIRTIAFGDRTVLRVTGVENVLEIVTHTFGTADYTDENGNVQRGLTCQLSLSIAGMPEYNQYVHAAPGSVFTVANYTLRVDAIAQDADNNYTGSLTVVLPADEPGNTAATTPETE